MDHPAADAKRVFHRLHDASRRLTLSAHDGAGPGIEATVSQTQGIDESDIEWMRRDLLSSLVGAEWFERDGRDQADTHQRMAIAVVRAMGWTEDDAELAVEVVRLAARTINPTTDWGPFVDRLATTAEVRGAERDTSISWSERA